MKKSGKFFQIFFSPFGFLPLLLWGALVACSGMSGGGGGLTNAAAPNYPVGVAAPNADPRGGGKHAAKANYEDFKVKAQLTPSAVDGNGGILYSLNIKGMATCMPLNAKDYSPCSDGHWVLVYDTFLNQFVETQTVTQNGEAGHFEMTFQGMDPKQNPKEFSGDFSKYDQFLNYYFHLKDDYKPSVQDIQRSCVVDSENVYCPPAGDFYPATVEN